MNTLDHDQSKPPGVPWTFDISILYLLGTRTALPCLTTGLGQNPGRGTLCKFGEQSRDVPLKQHTIVGALSLYIDRVGFSWWC